MEVNMSLNLIFCLIFIISGVQSSPVSLIVQDNIIVFGSTIHLLCTLDDSLNLTNGRSRQWSGGSENKVLSFNGFPSDPNKYKEDVISTRQFRLKIFNTSEADVNCFYKCVYGFKFDEKMLDLNTVKYQYIPTAHEIDNEINYNQEDRHISASLTFQNIYPLPQCMLSVGRSKLNMSVSRTTPHGLFYQLSMSIDYTWEDNSCGTEIKIECFIGERNLSIWKAQQEQCLEMTTETIYSVDKTMEISVILSVLLCSVVFLTLCLLWLRRRRAGNDETQNSYNDCESIENSQKGLVTLPIITVPRKETGNTRKPCGKNKNNGVQNIRKERLEYTKGRNEQLENGILVCDCGLGDYHAVIEKQIPAGCNECLENGMLLSSRCCESKKPVGRNERLEK